MDPEYLIASNELDNAIRIWEFGEGSHCDRLVASFFALQLIRRGEGFIQAPDQVLKELETAREAWESFAFGRNSAPLAWAATLTDNECEDHAQALYRWANLIEAS